MKDSFRMFTANDLANININWLTGYKQWVLR